MQTLMIVILALAGLATGALAQEEAREFRLTVADEVAASGIIAYLLPRFTLKTGRRAELVKAGGDVVIGPGGAPSAVPLMARGGAVITLQVASDNPAAARFAGWITSEIGQTAIASFVPDTGAGFTAAPQVVAVAEIIFEGDAALGERLSRPHCGRCHRVSADRSSMDIGSAPSFPALRALDDWAERFLAFYALNPHPAFLRVTGISPAFDPALPPPIVPIEITLDEMEAIQAYAAGLAPADLGSVIQHQ